MPDAVSIDAFQQKVWSYYAAHKRTLPWRLPDKQGRFDAYKIMVSEYMLQQTQVSRVIPKYNAFLEHYPTVEDLAAVPLANVVAVWAGLGYNRRAKFLWETAQVITDTFSGTVPATAEELTSLPGIGKNTAAAIMVYAYNQKSVFIETNIRTVFLYHFWQDGSTKVGDAEIVSRVEDTLPTNKNYREWYWALMDYGTHLKASEGNQLSRSKSHKVQTAFKGSNRQLRGQVIRTLVQGSAHSEALFSISDPKRMKVVIDQLEKEGMIARTGKYYSLG